MKQMKPWLTVVGMGDDGPDGLAPAARAVVEQARVVVGGQRHLHLVGHLDLVDHLDLPGPGERESIPWPKPFGALTETLDRLRGPPGLCTRDRGSDLLRRRLDSRRAVRARSGADHSRPVRIQPRPRPTRPGRRKRWRP